jgi:hypothetical protein
MKYLLMVYEWWMKGGWMMDERWMDGGWCMKDRWIMN